MTNQQEVKEVVVIPTRNLREGDTITSPTGAPIFEVLRELRTTNNIIVLLSNTHTSTKTFVNTDTLQTFDSDFHPLDHIFEPSVYAIFRKET
jgi:hypothetical protein